MKTFHGKGISNAIAIGSAFVISKQRGDALRLQIDDAEAALARLNKALTLAKEQLQKIRDIALTETDDAHAQIFDVHQMLLSDETFLSSIHKLIEKRHWNAEYAITLTADELASQFALMDDETIRERASDVKDVANRLITCLGTSKKEPPKPTSPSIICAEDLTPSETVALDKHVVLAFVTAKGSATSHVAILAKSMGIPAVLGVGDAFLGSLQNGMQMIVDGVTGEVFLDPDDETRNRLLQKQKELSKSMERLLLLRGKETKTIDGNQIKILANAGNLSDVEAALANDADGIGLFRSEFLYLESDDYPSEEQQFNAYRQILERMGDKEVILRTLDVGADKRIDYFHLEKEENPALGMRAIRLCLKRPEVFKTQLRALYRASAYGNLSILLPMITSISEVERTKNICEEVKLSLQKEGIPFNDKTRLGIMIETPAAALISDQLARLTDFFSIGTNDLTQYVLAMDRQSAGLDEFRDVHHDAVLYLIKMAVENAHCAGIPVGICGELATDEALLKTFLRMGIDELSVSASYVLPLRDVIRKLDLTNA